MLIQKLRLQRGWSQQLADLSGLSVRTIQRLEKGQDASTESLKSLAAVFEIDFSQLQRTDMSIAALFTLNIWQDIGHYWAVYPTLGWGLGLLLHAVVVFERFSPFGADWEKQQVEKRLGRKL